MKDFLITVIIIWFLYRLFAGTRVEVRRGPGNYDYNQEPQKPTGSVSIDYIPPKGDKKKKSDGPTDKDGDYVDYEEIK